ncbi:MAG TPA: hypothetical protein VM327_02185 [Candidatus Thermoplasmatota archaeon]|nr:hypothetical protein [Candidatus Thermoplasmatota archaeon]
MAATGPRWSAATLILAAFAASRLLLDLAGSTVFAVRDAGAHIYGTPASIAWHGTIPPEALVQPPIILHALLGGFGLVSGWTLWTCGAVAALALGLTTLLIVASTSSSLRKGTFALAAVGLVVYAMGVETAQWLQPMALALPLMAGLVHIVLRREPMFGSPVLFTVLLAALPLTHLYSSLILFAVLVPIVVTDAFVRQRVRFVVPLFALLLLSTLFILFVVTSSEYFQLLFRSYTPGNTATDTAFPTIHSPLFQVSALFTVWNTLAVASVLCLAAVAWLMKWRGQRDYLASRLGALVLAALFVAGLLVPPLLPVRILTLAAFAVAPLAAITLRVLPTSVRVALVAGLAFMSFSSVFVAHQYFPFSQQDTIGHALDETPPEMDTVRFMQAFAANALWRLDAVVSSHPLTGSAGGVGVQPLSGADGPESSPASYVVFRDESKTYGYSTIPADGTDFERAASYRSYPTADHERLLETLPRVGRFGPYAVYTA